jgi:hypothetical protein
MNGTVCSSNGFRAKLPSSISRAATDWPGGALGVPFELPS